jgi:hypothetical protein
VRQIPVAPSDIHVIGSPEFDKNFSRREDVGVVT